MSEVVIEDNILILENNAIIMKYPIKTVKEIKDKYIVLLKIPRVELREDELNNVFCYDKKGNRCWQISNKLPATIISKEQIPYIGLQIMGGELFATDFWGRKFTVDVETGKLIDVKTVR